MLSNFLSNAFKYTDAQCAVTVCLLKEGSVARVMVCDEGEGISEEALPHLFERFYRVTGAEVKSGSQLGLGLGLYICHVIIEMHHGQIGVESQHGHGANFWFTLPLPVIPDVSPSSPPVIPLPTPRAFAILRKNWNSRLSRAKSRPLLFYLRACYDSAE